MTDTLFVSNVNYRTLLGSTITTSTMTVSSITVSTMTVSTIFSATGLTAVGNNVSYPNRYLEVGADSANTMYLDFHSNDATLSDYSTRIISQGGATTGTGNLNMYASTIGFMPTVGVGIGVTNPSNALNVWSNLLLPTIPNTSIWPAQFSILGNGSAQLNLKLGAYYTGGTGEYCAIQSTESYGGVEHPTPLSLQPIGGYVGIGTTAPSAALHIKNATTAMRITGNLTNTSTRPAASTTPGAFEIRGSGATDGSDDGFLRLSSGGGSTTSLQSWIDISGYSTLPDMTSNIVFAVGAERMRITGAGYVGIGTAAPQSLLHIYGRYQSTLLSDNYILNVTSDSCFNGNGGVTVYSNSINFQAGDLTGMGTTSRGAQLYIGGGRSINAATNHGEIIMYTAQTERMRITGAGYVGIGMTNPSVPLYVNTSFNINITGGSWTASNYNVAITPSYSSTQYISAYFSAYASSSYGFLVYSDRRIKKDIEPATNCLDIVMKLHPVTYRKKNIMEDGNELHTGFIAQDVEEVYPSAIKKRTDTIPSIYEIRHAVLIENGIQITEPIDVPLDAKVVVIDFSNKKITMIHRPNNVLLFENQSDKIELDGDKVFIFGHEVLDKLMLNHDTLFSVGMGAIQELSEKATSQASLVQELASQTAQIAAENTELKSAIASLEARLAAAGL
jgi:hypothetical protein